MNSRGYNMSKIFTIQIAALIIVSGGLIGMWGFTPVYKEVQSRIVEVLCLSCMKLDPRTEISFTFETATGADHPRFILENLTKGPIFLHYSEDVCAGCEVMHPIIEEFFNIKFNKEDMVNEIVTFEVMPVVYYYINIDHTTDELYDTFAQYDKDNIKGLPMFTIITVGYDKGIIKPYYTSFYGTLKNTDQERIDFLTQLMQESMDIYHQNIHGYIPK